MVSIGKITKSYGFKVMLLVILIFVLLIPVQMVRGIIYERTQRARDAENEILQAWGGQFTVSGPVLKIPCRETEEIRLRDDRLGETLEIREHEFFLWLTPELLTIGADLATETKKRGIFSVPLFSGTVDFYGSFNLDKGLKELKPNQTALADQAELVFSLSSQKGIRKIHRGTWNGEPLSFEPGNRNLGVLSYSGGIHGKIPREAGEPAGVCFFDVSMGIQGGKSLRMLPLGEQTRVSVEADWPSPSFQGNYLPASHELGDEGFRAQWEISYLSRGIPLSWAERASGGKGPELGQYLFGVNFFKSLDHYALNERAIKYALLFLIVPFLTFFLLEILFRREIHPVQYLLAGIGNIIFYLLLLSFSEHLAFSAAYLIAAAALTAMMVLYTRSLAGSWGKSWYMGLVMGISYVFLYFTLQSEDWALLMGSVGAFGITGLVMFLTRKLDWARRTDTRSDTGTDTGTDTRT